MAADILQKTLRELHKAGITDPQLDAAVRDFEEAKDDRTRLSAGEHLRSTLARCIETAHHQLQGERRDAAITLCEALAAHVPKDPVSE